MERLASVRTPSVPCLRVKSCRCHVLCPVFHDPYPHVFLLVAGRVRVAVHLELALAPVQGLLPFWMVAGLCSDGLCLEPSLTARLDFQPEAAGVLARVSVVLMD